MELTSLLKQASELTKKNPTKLGDDLGVLIWDGKELYFLPPLPPSEPSEDTGRALFDSDLGLDDSH